MSRLTPPMPDAERSPPPDYAHYTEPAFRSEFLADMERTSSLQLGSPSGIRVLRYEPDRYDVRRLVADTLAAAGMFDRGAMTQRSDRLELLHEVVAPEHQAMDRSQQSAAARCLYEMPPAFAELHRRLVAEVVAPALSLGPVHLQRTPTFRVFFPHAPGYPGATSYHNDIMLGHNPRAVNVFVPLVACEGSRSLLLAELAPSLDVLRRYDADFARFGRDTQDDPQLAAELATICQPLLVDVGDIVVFDSRCLHAGPPNTTSLTRVTFDTRLLPANDLHGQRNVYVGRGRRRASFAIGDYFDAVPIGSA
jgi:hypothetical protein